MCEEYYNARKVKSLGDQRSSHSLTSSSISHTVITSRSTYSIFYLSSSFCRQIASFYFYYPTDLFINIFSGIKN